MTAQRFGMPPAKPEAIEDQSLATRLSTEDVGADKPVRPSVIDPGGLQNRIGYLLRRAQISVFRDFIQTMAEFDIRPAQFSVLTVIGANPGLTQRELGQTLGIEPARLVLMLDELERRGLSKRAPAPLDRRSRILSLTPQGKRQLRRLIELADEHERRMLAELDANEKAQLLQLLDRLCRD